MGVTATISTGAVLGFMFTNLSEAYDAEPGS